MKIYNTKFRFNSTVGPTSCAVVALILVMFVSVPSLNLPLRVLSSLTIPAVASHLPSSLLSASNAPYAPGSVTGFITDVVGTPLNDITVTAYRYQEERWHWAREAKSDDSGSYLLDGLQVGRYRIMATNVEGHYLKVYYGGVTDIESATELAIAGQRIDDIDITMVLGGRISGSVDLSSLRSSADFINFSVDLYEADPSVDISLREWDIELSETGEYFIKQVNPGLYRICASSEVLVDSTKRILRDCRKSSFGALGNGLVFEVDAGAIITDVDFRLGNQDDYGHISGQVTDNANVPLTGVAVIVESTQENVDAMATEEAGACSQIRNSSIILPTASQSVLRLCATTDESGRYSLPYVAPGGYTINFQQAGSLYSPSFYGGSSKLREAEIVEVRPSAAITNANGLLSEGKSIVGTVLYQGGSPLEETDVVAQNEENGMVLVRGRATIDPYTGQYEISGLLSGIYSITLESSSYSYIAGHFRDQTLVVDLTEGDIVTGANFTLAEGLYDGVIEGQVTNGEEPLADIQVELLTLNNAYPEPVYYTETDSDGNYTIGGLGDGSNRLRFSDRLGNHITQYYNETTILADAEIIQVGHRDTLTIDVALQLAGKISGNVDASGASVNRIGLFVRQRHGPEEFGEALVTEADRLGNFHISGLVPGNYVIDFYDRSLYPYQNYPSHVKSLLQLEATVRAGETTSNVMGVLGTGVPTALDTVEEPAETKPTVSGTIFIPFAAQ